MTSTSTTDLPQADWERLRTHFSGDLTQYHNKWDALWKESTTPWDRGTPNPALIDALTQRKDLFGSPLITDPPARPNDAVGGQSAGSLVRRKRALVPGCGKGYDVLLLASFGYDAAGLEISEVARGKCEEVRKEDQGKGVYEVRDAEVGKGEVSFRDGDFYGDEEGWKGAGAMGGKGQGVGFDLIYDYTFFCAMHPDFRPKWAKRMSELLAPNGRLVCLEFPLSKPPETEGPPWAVRAETYEEHLKRPGVEIPYDEDGLVVVEPAVDSGEDALIRIDRWKAERTHAIGKDTDHVSVWMHK